MLAALALFAAVSRAPAQTAWTNALSFDGTNDYVEAGNIPLTNASFTLEAWARRDSATTMDFILAQGAGTTWMGLHFGFHASSQFVLGFYNDDLFTANSYTDTNWHHWAGTYNAGNKARCLYRDGILVASNTATADYQGSGSLFIGRVPWTTDTEFHGSIDDVRIWNVARTAEEIKLHLNHPLSGTESNLVAYWNFDETAGTNAFDVTANNYDGILFGGVQRTISTIPLWGNALSLDGTNDYVKATAFAAFPSNAITVEFWMQSADTTRDGTPVSYATTNSDNTFLVYNYRNFQIYVAGSATPTSGISANDGQWHHIATTWSSGTGECLLYRDGMQVYHTNVATGAVLSSGGTLVLGQDQDSVGGGFDATQAFRGKLDEVRIWNRVRSQAEIQADLIHPLTGTESNLVAYWKFDEAGGTNVYDSTTNGHVGTLVNGPVWTNSTIPPFINIYAGLTGISAGSVAWGDYDNDGRLDILLTGYTGSSYIAQVWRNTGNGFTNINAGLAGVVAGSAAWGDYNNDGQLDILLTGNTSSNLIAQVWRNTGSGFTNINAGLTGVSDGSAAWGDYDNDGRLDILLTGMTSSNFIAQVWRNTSSGFTNINAGLTEVYWSSVAWGDYDNDGRLDILLTGYSASDPIAQVWRNTGSGFTNINAELTGVFYSSVAWGDYDNDGWLDILLTGTTNSLAGIAEVWRNTGSGFTNVTATVASGLTGVSLSSVAWGDYDNDGRLDILLTGTTNGYSSGIIARVWRNTGSGFTNINAGLTGVFRSSGAWGDYDNDGRLDILQMGYTGSSYITRVWRNIGLATNTSPSAPADLTADVVDRTVTLSWSTATDAQTSTNGLTYNLRVGTTPGGCDVVSPHADPTNGFRRVSAMGNLQYGLTAGFTNMPPGNYFWSVQAVDSAFAGSPFAAEQSFDVLCPPQVTTLAATNLVVSSNGCVMFRGTVNPGMLPTTAWFEWGTSTSYSNVTPAILLDATNVAVSVSNLLCGLAGGADYHIRLVASNSLDVVAGDDAEFTMPPFINISAGLTEVYWGSVAWGDYDNDGRLDILLTGYTGSRNIAEVWRNTVSGFTNINAGLTGVEWSSAAWGDYDNDGRLDILLTGYTGSARIAQVWRNTGNGFTNINAGLTEVAWGSVAWGDYDNDGRLDILLTGDSYTGIVAQVWRNTGSGFTNINAGLTGVGMLGESSSVAWGDYDNDGRLDILLTGSTNDPSSGRIAQVWRNTGSGFTNVNAGLTGVSGSSAVWGDYDNDGRLDILLTGTTNGSSFGIIAQMRRNTGSSFTNINAGLTGVYYSSVAWGDYDNDGRLDILLTGYSSSGPVAQVWRNTGSGFTNINAALTGVDESSVAWGDYDNDGRLDILLTGYTGSGQIAQVWRNIGPVANTLPTTPTSLAATVAGQAFTLSWSAAEDAQTPANGLTYNLRVGTAPGGSDVVSPHADPTNGFRRLPAMGNAQLGLGAEFPNLAPGNYYWSVQAVDNAFAGSPFAAEQSFDMARGVAIDATVTHQTIEGFGGSIVFYNNWLTAHPYKQEIYTNLFSGLNLGMLRIGNWFRYQGVADFDPDIRQVVSNANRILGRPMTIEMSSWSPPAFLKSNGKTTDGGTLVWTNGGFAYTNFANYWYDSLLWYQTNGVVLAYISIQNEPDWEAGWDSCKFLPNEDGTNYASYALALAATYHRLTNLPAPPKLLAPEVLGIGYSQVQNYAATMNSNYFYGVAHHLYHGGDADDPDTFISAMQGLTNVFPGKPKFQTEYGHGDMLQTALLTHHSLTVEEVSAYLFWSLVWPKMPPDVSGSALVQQEFPWNQAYWTNAPPGTPTPYHGYWLTPQYYAMKHFSYFITNSFRRVTVSDELSNVRISAYLAPENRRLVVVMICTNGSPSVVALNLNGFTAGASGVYQTVGTNAQTSQFALLGPAPANLQWTLPGSSITTVVLDSAAVTGPATNPNPTNGAFNVTVTPTLTWSPGTNATAHRVYFGYSSNAVAAATIYSPEYKGDLAGTNFNPGTLASSGRYFWRVDEMAGANATVGATWTFATAVNPADAPQASGGMAGSDAFVISFASQLGQTYRVEYSDSLNPAVWLPVADGLAGTGNPIQVTNTGAPFPAQRFYRVVLLSP